MKQALLVVAALALLGALAGGLYGRHDSGGRGTPAITRDDTRAAEPLAPSSWRGADPVDLARSVSEDASQVTGDTRPVPAWQSMAQAREHGDDRAPPIERPTPETQAVAPTAWDLSTPERYRQYEERGHATLRAEYLVAAEQQLSKLKVLLAQARATGAPPAAIREAEDKIRHLEQRQVVLRSETGVKR